MAEAESSGDGVQMDEIESEQITQVNEGVRIRSSITRGTGTRDEDDHTIEIERHDLDDALDDLDKALTAFEDEYLERVRNLDPERSDDADSDN